MAHTPLVRTGWSTLRWVATGLLPRRGGNAGARLHAGDAAAVTLTRSRSKTAAWVMRSRVWGPVIVFGALVMVFGGALLFWGLWPVAQPALEATYAWLDETIAATTSGVEDALTTGADWLFRVITSL